MSIGNYKSCNFPAYTYNTYDVKGRYVTNILNNSGTKTKEYEYNAFGVTEFETNANTYNPWQYCGEYRNEESGLIYLRNRYYDSDSGRFINEDTHWNVDNMIYGDKENEKSKNVNIEYKLDNEIYLKSKLLNYTMSIDEINKININYLENKNDYSPVILDNVLKNSHIKVKSNASIYPQINNIVESGNLYVYCINNPVKYRDSSGNVATAIGAGVGSVAGPVGTIVGAGIATAAGYVVGKGIVYFAKKSKSSDKDKANDIPSWAKGQKPKEGESGKDFAKRLMDGKYGEDNYGTGPGSEYNQLKKYGDRGGK